MYRDCLRWDFGFTCAFCLLHELDLFGGLGGEGLGGTTIEHRVLRSEDPNRQSEYGNCIYACRFCNRARSAHPLKSRGRCLLDPTSEAWGRHFVVREDFLKPVAGDVDAIYTHEAYDLDDPRKVERRRARRVFLSDTKLLLDELDGEIDKVMRLSERLPEGDVDLFIAVVQMVKRLREQRSRTLADLVRYTVIPPDAPTECRCATTEMHSLPEELAKQSWRPSA